MQSFNILDAFHFKDERLQPDKAVNYIPPEKRRQMKEYLINSSINLSAATGGDRMNVSHQFVSTNKLQLGTKLDQATPYSLLTKERKDTIEKNREKHIWMGRDNEFKKATNSSLQDIRVKALSASKQANSELKDRLRAHNFNFGYSQKGEEERQRMKSIQDAQSALQECQKNSGAQQQWRLEQVKRNRRSNIRFGADAQMLANQSDAAMALDDYTSRTQAIADFRQNPRGVVKSSRSVVPDNNSQSFLKQGGKKIDPAHVGGTTVASHIASTESVEPKVFDRQRVDAEFFKTHNSDETILKNKSTNFQIGQSKHQHLQPFELSPKGNIQAVASITSTNGFGKFRNANATRPRGQFSTEKMSSRWDLSPQLQVSGELGEDKRIKQDMVKQHIKFGQTHGGEGFASAKRASTITDGVTKEQLFSQYRNSNIEPTGGNLGLGGRDRYGKSTMAAQTMNALTSQVNTSDLSRHKQKIAEYKDRMLLQKQQLGYFPKATMPSEKGSKYVPYGKESYQSLGADKNIKQRVEKQNVDILKLRQSPVGLAAKSLPFNFKEQRKDSEEVQNFMNRSYVNLGFEKRSSSYVARPMPKSGSGKSLHQELGQVKQAAEFMRQRGNSSNVLPLNSSGQNLRSAIGSVDNKMVTMSKNTFKWNTPKYDI